MSTRSLINEDVPVATVQPLIHQKSVSENQNALTDFNKTHKKNRRKSSLVDVTADVTKGEFLSQTVFDSYDCRVCQG
jgi:hypothetical protein